MVTMIQSFRRAGILLLGLLMVVILGLMSVTAQDGPNESGNGLRIDRLRQEYLMTGGQSETYEVGLTNVSSGDLTVFTVVNDFESDDETGQPRLLIDPEEPSPFSLARYVTVPETFTLKPNESQDVTIGVNLPDSIAPGGYFGVVRFAAGVEGEEAQNISLAASVGSLLLVSVAGEVQESMELGFVEARQTLSDGTKRGGSFFETEPDVIAVNLRNTGNSILKPFGRVSVKNIFGQEVANYEFNGGQLRGNVLPQSARTFEDSVSGLGRIGRFTVESNISYGEGGGNIINAKTNFWVIPWKILLAVLVVIAFLVWFFTRGIKAYNRRVVSRAKKTSQN